MGMGGGGSGGTRGRGRGGSGGGGMAAAMNQMGMSSFGQGLCVLYIETLWQSALS